VRTVADASDLFEGTGGRGTVRLVMGMGGAGGPESERRRRLVAAVIVLAMILAVAATLFSTALR
jgi:hypothetical protein